MNKNIRNGANWALKKTCTFDGKLCAEFYECLDIRLSNNTGKKLTEYHKAGKPDSSGNEYNILAEICVISKRREQWEKLLVQTINWHYQQRRKERGNKR